MSLKKYVPEAFQERLKDLGYYTGGIDGDLGPLSSNAIIDFKRQIGFNATDYLTTITMERLFDKDAPKRPAPKPRAGEPLWIAEGRRLIGIKETPGAANNQLIMDWAEDAGIWYTGDDVPWCGLYMAHCIRVGSPESKLPRNPLGARNWNDFGEKSGPVFGAVAVFWRTHPTKSWNGHAGFLVGESPTTYQLLNGNVKDSVCVSHIAKDRLLGFRVPTGFVGEKVPRVAAGQISINEA